MNSGGAVWMASKPDQLNNSNLAYSTPSTSSGPVVVNTHTVPRPRPIYPSTMLVAPVKNNSYSTPPKPVTIIKNGTSQVYLKQSPLSSAKKVCKFIV